MSLLLDVQSELSLPYGGCSVDALIRRAAELGLAGLALADRRTLAASPRFVRAARAAGLEPRVGVRVALSQAHGVDLLLFPRRTEALTSLELLGEGAKASAADLARAGGEEAILALAVVRPQAVADKDRLAFLVRTLGQVRAVIGNGLRLALPDFGESEHSSLLVELGRDLSLPQVPAPPVCIVEVEDAPLHRMLVTIRGDHEGSEVTPRPGRPAPKPERLRPEGSRAGARARWPGSLVEAAGARGASALHEAAREFFAQIAAPDLLVEPPAPDPHAWEDMASLHERVLAACSGRRRLPPEDRLTIELEAIARRGALGPVIRLHEVSRALSSRPTLGVAPGWSASWVGWALGFSSAPLPEEGGRLPAWVGDHGPLPLVELETGEAGARTGRTLAEIGGAREPLAADRLTPAAAARWLGEAHGFDSAQVRRLVALVEERSPSPDRAPPGSRRLAGLAVRLAGRVIGLSGAADIRVWAPFSTPGRRVGRLAEDAIAAGPLAVRVMASPTLALLEKAGVGGRLQAETAAGEGAGVAWSDLAQLLAGPLAGRGGAAFARALHQRRPKDRRELARALVLLRRAPDAPSPRLPVISPGQVTGGSDLILFISDLVGALRERGIAEQTAEEMIERGAEGHGAALNALRPEFQHQLQAAGQTPEAGEALISALIRLAPHLEEEGPWLARSAALAMLGDLARADPASLVAALADLHPVRLPAIELWARTRGVTIAAADLDESGIDSRVEGGDGGASVRLGLIHLPGMDRATVEVVAAVRGRRAFAGPDDLVRRLRGRIPDSALRALLGREGPAWIPSPEMDTPPESAPRTLTRSRRRIRKEAPGFAFAHEGGGNTMQYDLFTLGRQRPRIFTAALARHGILSLDGALRSPDGSRVRTVGVILGLRGVMARGGRRLAAARLEDGGAGLDLLLTPEVFEAADDIPLGGPVVVEGRIALRDGRTELVVESAVPFAFLAGVAQPALEVVLPVRFRRVRALKLRLLRSPGRSPLRVQALDPDGRAIAAVLSRLAVTLDDELVADLRGMVGNENVHWVGRGAEQAGAA